MSQRDLFDSVFDSEKDTPDRAQHQNRSARNARTVTQLTMHIKTLLEGSLKTQWVCGEVSNCRPARSGHVYLTLKDEQAQISVVVWKSTAERLGFDLTDGLEVVLSGTVEVYQARGNYQLIAQQVIPQGVGALQLQLEQLKQKLNAEGLFDKSRKRPLPTVPRRIALITSHRGAAVKDILQVITRRWPSIRAIVVPVSVQGDGAARQIANALRRVHELEQVDVVICGRGGGSLEDLWAFNEEIVARAIADCRVPVISAVGHEIDVTIADLVADCRALTPSEAGEIVVPDQREFLHQLQTLQSRLVAGLKRKAQTARLLLDALASRPVLANPLQPVRQQAERLDDLHDRLLSSMKRRFQQAQQDVSRVADALNALSPLSVLARGFSTTFRVEKNGERELLNSSEQVKSGDQIVTRLAQGEINSVVK